MKPLLSSLEGMTSMFMASQQAPHTAQSIRDIIAQLRSTPMFAGQVEDGEAEELARLIEEKYGISMGLGAIVDAKDFRPWLHDARINGEVGDFYWGRYRKLLNIKGMPKSVIDATDEVTDKVLDRLGDPNNTSPWSRRGMVVGHVQSGKTQNYTGLICKAADAGYRLIVVIAGIHNNLRNQTQARIDEGFIGRDTGRLAHVNKAQRQKLIGVGEFDQREFPVSLTNTLRDFNKATATTFTAQLGQFNVPVVLVIKKNSSTLKNLLEWLKEHSAHQSTQMVSQPMLVIDDEADNASINTAYARDEVTYAMAKVFHDASGDKQVLDLDTIWRRQSVPEALQRALLLAAAEAHDVITHPPTGVRNMSEWAKQQACWNGMKGRALNYDEDFESCLTLVETVRTDKRDEKSKKAIEDGINVQSEVVTFGPDFWKEVLTWGRDRKRLTPKDQQILEVCVSMPRRVPSDLQSRHALDVLGRMRDQGFGDE